MTPEGWQRRRVREFCERARRVNVDGVDLEPLSITKDRGVILQSEKYNKRIATDPRKYVFAEDGDFAFDPMSLYYGAIGRVGGIGRGLVSPDYVVFKADETVDGNFLHALLRYPEMHKLYESLSETGNTFGKRRRLYWSIFEDIELELPPLAEQRKIAAILSSVDEAVEATQAVIDQLGVVKKAIMAELLTRGLPGRHTRFKQSEIGDVPEKWSVLPIERLIDFCDYGLSKSLTVQPGGVAVLRMGNLAGGRVVLDDLKYIDSSEVKDDLLLAPGDVLFNRTNSKDLVGKVGVFGGASFKVSFASYLLRLRPSAPHSGHWLGAVMNLESHQAALRAMATPGVSQVNINRGKMLAMKVPVPPPEEQRDLMAILSGLDERLATERAVASQIAAVKAALMSVLLTGEVRVKPDASGS
jgi:type I restriction enzyme S subunit